MKLPTRLTHQAGFLFVCYIRQACKALNQFMTDTLKVLGRNIKQYRTRLGMTQADLAEKSNVYRSHLAGIETGSANPSVKTLEKLAIALEVTVEELFKA